MTFYKPVKRLIDILGSIVGIIVFSPIMLVTAIYIKIVSPKGPIFADIPLRVGKDGKEFRMYKFRSMIPNAHQFMLNNPEMKALYQKNGYKLDPDPRLLPGAKFIRKSSIDELPQFFNVLLGNMSIVGFRAYYRHEITEQLAKFPEAKPYIDDVFSAKPGITGLWQISGRSELSFVERVKLDAKYAKKRSILYDLVIILKTPYVVLSNKGAY